MKKLLLLLLIITGVGSLLGMEPMEPQENHVVVTSKLNVDGTKTDIDYSKLPPITLPQIYHYLAKNMNRDVARYIFSLQPGLKYINDKDPIWGIKINNKDPIWRISIQDKNMLLKYFGYCYTLEWLNRHYLSRGISICDIKYYGITFSSADSLSPKDMQFFLRIAGKDAWKLISTRDCDCNRSTSLHYAALRHSDTETIKLIVDAAGDNAWTLLMMQDARDFTALHNAVYNGTIEKVKSLLDISADYDIWTLLTKKTVTGNTALHTAAFNNAIEAVKLLLDAAGDRVQDFMGICNKAGKNAFDIAKPEIQEIMKPYFQKQLINQTDKETDL